MKIRRSMMLIVVVAMLLASQASVAIAAPLSSSNCVKYHQVQAGENLFRIGLQYGLTVEALMQANGLYNPNTVYAGQSLCIPGNTPAPAPNPQPSACNVHYTIKWGDTLSGIAARYGTTLTALMQANRIVNANFIYAGMIILIPCKSSGGTPATYPQWKGEYFNNADLAGAPSLTRNDANINFNWGQGWPNPKLSADNYSVRWTRSVYFKTGTYRFSVKWSGGVRMYVDGVPVLDAWASGADAKTPEVVLGAGNHTLVLEFHKISGQGSIYLSWQGVPPPPGPQPTPIPGATPVASSSAWTGYYFGNQYLDDLKFTRIDPSIDFNWDRSSPGTGVPRDLWSARWISTQYFASAGLYEFYAQVDDGVRIYVDNNLVVNDWFDHRGVSKGTVNLTAGPHTVKVEYYDFGREAMITVWWAKK
ncbi:MAG: LysM peptidoglycan-binding domain-containing protein [Thermoflexales bacterium]|nr:LysM peptidoglycan-binding domain-containing protein [Thermoflexales bacterium]